jgi:hypothetical protein
MEQLYFGVDLPNAWRSALRSIIAGKGIFAMAMDADAPIKQLLQVSSHNVYTPSSYDASRIRFNTAVQFASSDKVHSIEGRTSCSTDPVSITIAAKCQGGNLTVVCSRPAMSF